jgi:hypothetical protein
LKIALSTLGLSAAWAIAISHSPGLYSTPTIWMIWIGLPGVAIAVGLASISEYVRRSDSLAYFIMFLGNRFFFWGAVKGFLSLKRKFSK